MARPRKLLVFDLETVPDVALARSLWGEACEGLDDLAVTQLIWNNMKEQNPSGSEFPRLPFHRIVAIGCLLAAIEEVDGGESYHFERLGCIGEVGDDEAALLQAFADYGAKSMREGRPVRLVGFNSRGFDVPTLKMRCLKHGVALPWLFQAGDKWSNYNARYDMVWHVDMLDAVGDFGAARGAGKLDEVCVLAGLPGKLDVEGSKVGEMFAAGKVAEIRDYCETDVLNTYVLYLKYQHLAGVLHPSALAAEEARVREWLATQAPTKPHLAAFADAWKDHNPSKTTAVIPA